MSDRKIDLPDAIQRLLDAADAMCRESETSRRQVEARTMQRPCWPDGQTGRSDMPSNVVPGTVAETPALSSDHK